MSFSVDRATIQTGNYFYNPFQFPSINLIPTYLDSSTAKKIRETAKNVFPYYITAFSHLKICSGQVLVPVKPQKDFIKDLEKKIHSQYLQIVRFQEEIVKNQIPQSEQDNNTFLEPIIFDEEEIQQQKNEIVWLSIIISHLFLFTKDKSRMHEKLENEINIIWEDFLLIPETTICDFETDRELLDFRDTVFQVHLQNLTKVANFLRQSINQFAEKSSELLTYTKSFHQTNVFYSPFSYEGLLQSITDNCSLKAHEKGIIFINLANDAIPVSLIGNRENLVSKLTEFVLIAIQNEEKGSEIYLKTHLIKRCQTYIIISFNLLIHVGNAPIQCLNHSENKLPFYLLIER